MLLDEGKKFSAEAALDALAKARGCLTAEEVAVFKQRLPVLHNPFPSIPGSTVAMGRIKKAIERQERVVIIGDYDVDGTISTVLLFELLSRAGLKASCFIPDRIEDDYGVTVKAADKCMAEFNPHLVISVDCGSTSLAVIADLKAKGVDFIVLDHHEPIKSDVGHPSLAHLNPKAHRGISPLIDEAATLCAGGLVFFFAEYLAEVLPAQGWSRDRSLILAGIATVADVMPLTRTNRALVRHSISLASTHAGKSLVPGLTLLLERAGAPEFTSKTYGWVIGPHLNAAGRVSHARIAANLIATRKPDVMAKGVEELIATNKDRKAVQDRVQEESMRQAEEQMALNPNRRFLILFGDDWHPGVVGIVAGRVRERFRLPAIVCGLHPEEGYWKGSARGVKGGNLGNIVHAAVTAGVLLGGGGHAMAAGLKVARGREDEVRNWFETYTAGMVWDTEDSLEVLGPYGLLKTSDWTALLEQAGPFGNESPEPVMLLKQAVLAGNIRVLKVGATQRPFGIAFDLAEDAGLGRKFNICWAGLATEDEFAAAEAVLRAKRPTDYAVRQVIKQRDGMAYVNLDLAGLAA